MVVLLVFIMPISVFADSMNINISRSKVSASQPFDGALKLSFSRPVDVDSDLVFNVDGSPYFTKLRIVYKYLGLTSFLPPSFEKSGNTVSEANTVFDSSGYKTVFGIDLSQTQDISAISKFKIGFNAEPVSGSYPSLALDVGNDGVIDYIYKGTPTDQYDSYDSSFLGDQNPDQWKGMRGNNQDRFCQVVSIRPSDEFKITAKIRKVNDGATLNASIKTNIDEIPDLRDCSIDKCCTMSPTGSEEYSCNLNLGDSINQVGNYSVCVTAFGGDESDTNKVYFNLAADTDASVVQGWYNGDSSFVDHFIFVSRRLFDNRLKSQVDKELPSGIIDSYITSGNCDGACLFVPLKIYSDYAGKIKLNNLEVNYQDRSGPSSIVQFTPGVFFGERANPDNFSVPLNIFEGLKSPSAIGSNHNIYAEVRIQPAVRSNTLQFEVVQGPPVSISYSPTYPSLGQEVSFSANIRSDYRKQIVGYEWDFGSNTKKVGKNVKFIFNELKKYTIFVTAVDSDGAPSREYVIIDIRPLELSIGSRVSDSLSTVSSVRSSLDLSSSQTKDTASLIGFTDKLTKLESNLRSLNVSISKIVSNSSMPSEEKNRKLQPLNSQLLVIERSIPLSISVDISSYPATITNINEIPSNIGGSEDERKAIFIAQEVIDVSGDSRKVNIKYFNMSEEFIVIKKVISSGSGNVYEVLPEGLSLKEVISPKEGYEALGASVIKFNNAQSFVYTINEADLDISINARTIVVPADLKFEESKDTISRPIEVEINNSISLVWIFLPAVIVIILIIYFGLFFKGGFLNKKHAKNLFKTDKDYQAVRSFVMNALAKGAKQEDIKKALRTKGWNDRQIDAVIHELIGISQKSKLRK